MIRSGSGGRRPADRAAAAGPPARSSGAFRFLLSLLALAAAAAGIAAADRSPLPHGGLSTGFAVLIGVVFVIAALRTAAGYRAHMRRTFPKSVALDRLRNATFAALLAAAVLVPVIAIALHYRPPADANGGVSQLPTANPSVRAQPDPATALPRPTGKAVTLHLPFGMILLVLGSAALAVAVAAAVIAATRMIAGLSKDAPVAAAALPVEGGGEDLAEALDAGRRALAGDDARAAIIACYAAMEESLAAAGEARRRSDSPSDLLARATSRRLVDPAPARELTELFREARFSTHPMDEASLQAARRALDTVAGELAASLAARSDGGSADEASARAGTTPGGGAQRADALAGTGAGRGESGAGQGTVGARDSAGGPASGGAAR